jgi:hypothetical protein
MTNGLWFYSKELDMTIHEIEQAVTELSPRELARFRQWFDEFDAQVCDEQFENDANSGKLDKLANKAVTDFRAGKAKEL